MNVFLPYLLTLTLCLAAVHAKGPTPNPKELTRPTLVAEACKNATDPNLCASSLNADLGTKTADLTRLALVALRMAASSGATAWVRVNETLDWQGFSPKNDRYHCLSGNTAITFKIHGTLVAASDYNLIGNTAAWILFRHVNRVNIYGGILDGQGTGLWICNNSGKSCPNGAAVRPK